MDDESGESMELMEECHSKNWVMQNWRDYGVLTEGSRELIPKTRGSILEGMICYS